MEKYVFYMTLCRQPVLMSHNSWSAGNGSRGTLHTILKILHELGGWVLVYGSGLESLEEPRKGLKGLESRLRFGPQRAREPPAARASKG